MLSVEEIKSLMDADAKTEKKKWAKIGQRYYDGDHDIRKYRIFYYNADGELKEDTMRTNVKIPHGFIKLNKTLTDESEVLVTKVEYPADVVMGAINMLKWDLDNRKKVGIQQETISRHSVTYFNMDGGNSEMGYPKSLMGFLKPYKKARI